MTRFNLPLDAPPYVQKSGDPWPVMSTSAPASSEAGAISPSVLRASEPQGAPDTSGPRSRQAETNSMLLGERVYARVRSIQRQYAAKITGMIVNGLQLSQQFTLLSSDENFRNRVEEAAAQLRKTGYNVKESEKSAKDNETVPLFYKSSKSGFYTPIPGNNSPQRLNAFRNVGRLIGICLQQMEIFPLHVCRHVLKFILDRQITWFDLAFYDPAIFDSLRSIVFNEVENVTHSKEFYESLQVTFAVDMPSEEVCGILELKPGGENIPVTKENVLEYIYLFVEHCLLGSHLKCLEAIRHGVYDVIPPDSLANLTAEDIRLIMCGTQDISLPLLQSCTSFLDESSAPSEVLQNFKQLPWSVASKFTPAEKQ
ncbi:E3 ubiquitin-protein ligase UBR5, partial [Aphelenchoides avenae]